MAVVVVRVAVVDVFVPVVVVEVLVVLVFVVLVIVVVVALVVVVVEMMHAPHATGQTFSRCRSGCSLQSVGVTPSQSLESSGAWSPPLHRLQSGPSQPALVCILLHPLAVALGAGCHLPSTCSAKLCKSGVANTVA